MSEPRQAFLFDLDGTLVDSVYQHVLAWHEVLDSVGIDLAVWRIHRRVGMSGGLFANALLRETGREVTAEQAERLTRLHGEAYARRSNDIRPLPGAKDLLGFLTAVGVPWAVATSGQRRSTQRTIALLDVPEGVPMVTRDEVARAKPDPDLFLSSSRRVWRAGRRGRGRGGAESCAPRSWSRWTSRPGRTASRGRCAEPCTFGCANSYVAAVSCRLVPRLDSVL
jgi:beta-phosphoglucomutase-like phosphatase (HAD superfamily)